MDVRQTIDRVAELMQRVSDLTTADVLVGIPAANAGRDETKGPTNAQLGRIHEFGSPAHNIPARPFLYPGVKKIRAQAIAIMKKGAGDVLLGHGSVDKILNQVGMLARNSVVESITDPAPPFVPLKPATIRARMRKTAGGRRKLKQFKKKGGFATWAYAKDPVTGNPINVKPLIDSGQLRAAISFVIRKGVS